MAANPARGQLNRENYFLTTTVQADHERDRQLHPIDAQSAESDDHTRRDKETTGRVMMIEARRNVLVVGEIW